MECSHDRPHKKAQGKREKDKRKGGEPVLDLISVSLAFAVKEADFVA